MKYLEASITEVMEMRKERKKILYVFDDINYSSGAQSVMLYQISCLASDYVVKVFSLAEPGQNIRQELAESVDIIGDYVWDEYSLYAKSLNYILKTPSYNIRKKLKRIMYSFRRRFQGGHWMSAKTRKRLALDFEACDSVIVVSEASSLRKFVAELKNPKKIQWIHTDYASWRNYSSWTRAITAQDARLYQQYDVIVVLSEYSRKRTAEIIPEIADKLVVIPNLIDEKKILQGALQDTEWSLRVKERKKEEQNSGTEVIRIITVGRLEKEKRYDRILDVCGELKKDGVRFEWYLVGSGSLEKEIRERIVRDHLEGNVFLTGQLRNPYSLMVQCDWFVLMSEYEGMPVTIDEAMVLGIPVLATDAGGIREQVERGGGEIVENNIVYKLKKNKDLYKNKIAKSYKIYYYNINIKLKDILNTKENSHGK